MQRTIKRDITFEGIGLHTGRICHVTLKPAPRDSGIVFIRTDRNTAIKAHVSSVMDTAFATTIGFNGTRIKTIEHLLSAFSGIGIDNITVEVDGPEIPVLDGSSSELVYLILKAGIAKQGKKHSYIRITKPVVLDDGHAEIMALPYNGRRITYSIHFRNHIFGIQSRTIDIDRETFVREIAPARTYGFLKHVEMLRASGLAKGGSLENAVVIDEKGILNESGLRFSDEFVRHKILDLLGDLYLIGYPIYGHIIANKAGHSSHIRFLRKLLSSTNSWEFVEGDPESTSINAPLYQLKTSY
jgi:UDP-3-O-[3-hydroxymyristoyl] N-acetylglucosamine deacetylase